MEKSETLEYNYLQDNLMEIGVIKENDKVRIAKVEFFDNACIYKIYYGRDLADVYKKIKACKVTKHLAQIYEVVYYEGNTHIIEERLSGENLAEYIENKGAMDKETFNKVVEEICEALNVLHNNEPQILHRDIKPSNIMLLKDGTVKLFDFDSARSVDGDKQSDTVCLGTKGYAPPEQYGFCETGEYSDIYSLGMTMYELLTGTMLEISINKRIYQCDDRYKRIIEKCVEFDISKRYSTIKELQCDFVKCTTNVEHKDDDIDNTDFDKFKAFLYNSMLDNSLTNDIKRFTYEEDSQYQKKLRQVTKMIKYYFEDEVVRMIYDDTLIRNGKCGMVITNQRIIDIYMNKSVRIVDVEDVIAKEKTKIIVKSTNKEIAIPCTGKYELRKVLAEGLKLLCKLQEDV